MNERLTGWRTPTLQLSFPGWWPAIDPRIRRQRYQSASDGNTGSEHWETAVLFFTLTLYLFWEQFWEAVSSDMSGLSENSKKKKKGPMRKPKIGRQRHFSKFYHFCLGLCLHFGHSELVASLNKWPWLSCIQKGCDSERNKAGVSFFLSFFLLFIFNFYL